MFAYKKKHILTLENDAIITSMPNPDGEVGYARLITDSFKALAIDGAKTRIPIRGLLEWSTRVFK